jgi:hypothetical protein
MKNIEEILTMQNADQYRPEVIIAEQFYAINIKNKFFIGKILSKSEEIIFNAKFCVP